MCANYKGADRREHHETPDELIKEMFSLLTKYYDGEIVEYLENSAGKGRIIDYFDKPYIAFDIEKYTDRDDIKICNYLKEKIPYKKGRVAVINPPFSLGLKFVYKALEECDYCVCILSQNSILNMDYSKYWCDEIQLWRNYGFENTKVSVSIMAVTKKKPGQKYEYE